MILLLRSFCCLLLTAAYISVAVDLPIYLHYDDVGPMHRLLHKREAESPTSAGSDDSNGDFDGEGFTMPTDVEVQEDSEDHIYYMRQVWQNSSEMVSKYYTDPEILLEKEGVVGNRSHVQLTRTHRRAVGVNLTFTFPFYGHQLTNLTIATGGFLYVGDQTHSWLAATQFIAPLMANFNTLRNGSSILYADDGEKFVVEWRDVQLKNQEDEGTFTFQTTLFKNGDIVFVYRDMPMEVSNISDAHHPVKLGISDAYLFEHGPHDLPYSATTKRIIYEYHRVVVPREKVATNTVVYLTAKPTCISLTSCEACSNATLEHFNCSWCFAKQAQGGSFCTDTAGLHRRRHDYVKLNCREQSKSIYCSDSDGEKETETGATSTITTPTATSETSSAEEKPASGGMRALVFFLAFTLVAVGWVAYAYYNPHTTSGQLLIRYRPSQWRVPSSHVRYSASVHM